MEQEKKLFLRVLELATGISAVTTVVVLSTVIGLNAYRTFQPAALEAQAINISAANAPVTTPNVAAACKQEIATAAARGTPDTQSVITDQTTLNFQDNCVAAVLNPAVTSLGPNDPGSYMCVGKSASVNIVASGVITDTAIPNPAVPAGTCTAVACSPGAGGASSCIAANNFSSLNGTNLENTISAAQSSTLSPDSGITSFTMNADGSIVNESADTANVLDTGAGDQGLAGNSAGLEQSASAQPISASGDLSGGTPSIGQTEAVAAQPPETPEIANTGVSPSEPTVTPDTNVVPAETAAPTPEPTAAGVTGPETTPSEPISASTDVTPPEQIPGSGNTVPSQLPDPELNGPQPTSPTITNSTPQTGDVAGTTDLGSNVSTEAASSQNIFEQAASIVTKASYSVYDTVGSWFGLQPADVLPPGTGSAPAGIRG